MGTDAAALSENSAPNDSAKPLELEGNALPSTAVELGAPAARAAPGIAAAPAARAAGNPWLRVILWPLLLLIVAEVARWVWLSLIMVNFRYWPPGIVWPLVEVIAVGALAFFVARREFAQQEARGAQFQAEAERQANELHDTTRQLLEDRRRLDEENGVLKNKCDELDQTLKVLEEAVLLKERREEATQMERDQLLAERDDLLKKIDELKRNAEPTEAAEADAPTAESALVPIAVLPPSQDYTPLIALLREGRCEEEQTLEYLHQVAGWVGRYHAEGKPYMVRPETVLAHTTKNQVALNPSLVDDRSSRTFYRGFSAPESLGNLSTPASDVFSLGALLYVHYTRQLPPSGQDLLDALEHLNVNSSVPGVSYLLRKALWPYPDQRLPNAGAFDALLQSLRARHAQECEPDDEPDAPLLDVGADFNVGLRKGRNRGKYARDNEDRLFWDVDEDRKLYLLAVADGISTADIGSGFEAANEFTVVTAAMWEEVRRGELLEDSKQVLCRLFDQANAGIVHKIKHRLAGKPLPADKYTMGTAACAALCVGSRATVANLGDVRAYLVGDGWSAKITHDHATLSALLADPASVGNRSNVSSSELAGYLGMHTLREGGLKPAAISPHVVTVRLLPGEALVLVSDGAYGSAGGQELFEDHLAKIVKSAADAQLAAFRIMSAANQRSGQDNISCIVCRRPVTAEDTQA